MGHLFRANRPEVLRSRNTSAALWVNPVQPSGRLGASIIDWMYRRRLLSVPVTRGYDQGRAYSDRCASSSISIRNSGRASRGVFRSGPAVPDTLDSHGSSKLGNETSREPPVWPECTQTNSLATRPQSSVMRACAFSPLPRSPIHRESSSPRCSWRAPASGTRGASLSRSPPRPPL